ncbi:siroheme synthase CysG [Pseudovibrio exalbescens]|uniref:siroheme synthase CysG n=1 Tax=Pseudovibrio exalbescens TaxID=197461 RepID=UPI002367040E|nr:siroheme synthase CysG [Pseudovibrio exalbescens]MDD7912101.1 siroheme synthase CysG [Pseudovibrio exalbescens]
MRADTNKTVANERKLAVFPTFQKVAGRTVVIVGSGGEAAPKVRLLAQTQANILIIAEEEPEEELLAAAAGAGAEVRRERFRPEHVRGAALVFGASGDEDKDRAVVEAGRAAGIPSNAVDRPELCDFYVGALVNRAPVAVAITSTGVGPVYARHIRAAIEAMLPMEAGRLARLAENLRDVVSTVIKSGRLRRRFWAQFFSGSIAANVFKGDEQKARLQIQRLLSDVQDEAGYVWLVGAGPGAEDLLTLRAQRVLQEADVIFYDALVPEAVVSMGRRDAERISVGKRKGQHSVSQKEINAHLVEAARQGKRVVRLKAGDPLIFGRAGEEMEALREAQIDFEVVPGVTAAFAAAASTQLPLTLRGVASSLVFATGHDQDGKTLPRWAQLALSGSTTAVYMGRTVAGKIAARLLAAGLKSSTPVMAVENAAHPDERVFAGTLREMTDLAARDDIAGPVLIVIGDVVAHADLSSALPLGQTENQELLASAAA